MLSAAEAADAVQLKAVNRFLPTTVFSRMPVSCWPLFRQIGFSIHPTMSASTLFDPVLRTVKDITVAGKDESGVLSGMNGE